MNLYKTKPKQPSRCHCLQPLFSFPVCAQCKKVIYNLENQSQSRKRTVVLSIELTRLMNDYQVILESYNRENPQEFIKMKTQFIDTMKSIIDKSFSEETSEIEKFQKERKIQQKSQTLINEIVSTERDYNMYIELTLKHYLNPLEKHLKNDCDEMKHLLIEMKDISDIFLNIMEKKEQRENVLMEIEKHMDRLNCYADYFVLYHKSSKLLETIRKNDEFEMIRTSVKELR